MNKGAAPQRDSFSVPGKPKRKPPVIHFTGDMGAIVTSGGNNLHGDEKTVEMNTGRARTLVICGWWGHWSGTMYCTWLNSINPCEKKKAWKGKKNERRIPSYNINPQRGNSLVEW